MLLRGKAVAEKISEENRTRADALKEKGITPCLAIFRIGLKESDLSYEIGALKRCNESGVDVKRFAFAEDVSEEEFYAALDQANQDKTIHGILVFRPAPKRFDDNKLRNSIAPEKDVDGCSDLSLAGIFVRKDLGFAPCTAEAAIEILDHYGIECKGRNAVVLGRSLVIGKPVSMLLLNRNATVTICHTGTKNVEEIASKADILICATGQMETVNRNFVNERQTLIDVGISWNKEKHKLCGDALFEEVEPIVENITPVPGGVGSVTTSILVRHVIEAAEKQTQ